MENEISNDNELEIPLTFIPEISYIYNNLLNKDEVINKDCSNSTNNTFSLYETINIDFKAKNINSSVLLYLISLISDSTTEFAINFSSNFDIIRANLNKSNSLYESISNNMKVLFNNNISNELYTRIWFKHYNKGKKETDYMIIKSYSKESCDSKNKHRIKEKIIINNDNDSYFIDKSNIYSHLLSVKSESYIISIENDNSLFTKQDNLIISIYANIDYINNKHKSNHLSNKYLLNIINSINDFSKHIDAQKVVNRLNYMNETTYIPDIEKVLNSLNSYFKSKKLDLNFDLKILSSKPGNDERYLSTIKSKSSVAIDYKNYEGLDFIEINKQLPFTLEEFHNVKAVNPISLKENYPKYYESYLELNKLVLDHYSYSKEYIDKYMLARYAIGFSGNTNRAWQFLKEYVKYKEDYCVNKLGYSKNIMSKELYDNLVIDFGSDIYGRPFVFMQANLFNPKQLKEEDLCDYLMCVMERSLDRLPKNIDKVSIILDFKGVGSNNFSIKHTKAVKEVMNTYYVERTGNIIVINKGMFFTFAWNIIKGFMPERVLQKVIVVDESKKPFLKRLLGNDLYSKLGLK